MDINFFFIQLNVYRFAACLNFESKLQVPFQCIQDVEASCATGFVKYMTKTQVQVLDILVH